MATIGLAFLAGVLSILSPCVLPLLPMVLGGRFLNISGARRRLLPDSRFRLRFSVSSLLFSASHSASTRMSSATRRPF